MIYNNNTAKSLWKDLKIYDTTDRNGRKYVTAPNPGRDSSKSVPLYKFLLKTYSQRDVRVIKNLIYEGKIKVNDVVVKTLKHPLQFYDYLTIEDNNYIVVFKKSKKIHQYFLTPYYNKQFILPVRRWYLKKGVCMVNTYQNKLFSFSPAKDLYDNLRKLESAIYYNPETRDYVLQDVPDYKNIIKLTGKQIYQLFTIEELSQYDNKINMLVKGESKSIKIILPKSSFRSRYIPCIQ